MPPWSLPARPLLPSPLARLTGAVQALAGRRVATPRRGLVASGRRLPTTFEFGKKPAYTKASKWQDAAWAYNDEIGFMKSTNNQVADASGRVRTFPAIAPGPGLDPIPLDEAVGEVEGVTPGFAGDAEAVYSRIRNESGTIRELQRRAVLNLNVPGDAVLIGEEADTGETWQLHSSSALDWRAGQWWVRTGPSDRTGRELDPDRTNIVHVMRPHGQWPDVPDSNMRGLLGACELLTALTRGDLAVAQSRIANAGILFVSNDLEVPGLDASEYDGDSDYFTETLGEGMMQAIRDPASADAIVPLIVRADGPLGDSIAQVKFDRPMTEETLRKVDATILYIARGLYAPPEWTLGIGDSTTYATARVVDREGYLRYLDPTMMEWCAGLTTGWLRPALTDMGYTPTNSPVADVVVWRDPSSILARAEPTVAKDKGTELLLARVATINEVRSEYGWTPTDDGDRTLTDAEAAGLRRSAPGAPQDAPDEQTNPNAGDPDLSLTASVAPEDRAAQRLGHIDRVLFDRLMALADKALGNTLNIAGSRLRARASASTSPFRDLVKRGMAAHDVAAALGPDRIAILAGGDTQPLFDGTLDRYRDDFDTIVSRAQDQSRETVLALGEWDDAETRDRQAHDRRTAWTVFVASLLALASGRLLSPTVVVPDLGEWDGTLAVPGGLARRTAAAAGGQIVADSASGGLATPTGAPATGVGTGPTIRDLLRQALRAEFQGWVWLHGDPERPFEPHADLDGEPFQNWEDPVLANTEGWPSVEFYRPGDHDGCTCTHAPASITFPDA